MEYAVPDTTVSRVAAGSSEDNMAKVYLRGGIWHASFMGHDGHRIRKSTGIRERKLAEQVASRWEMQHALVRAGVIDPRELGVAEHGGRRLIDLLPDWSKDLPNTVHGDQVVAWVKEFVEKSRIATCREWNGVDAVARIEGWLGDCKDVRPETLLKKRAAVKRFGDFLVRRGMVRMNAAEMTRLPRAGGGTKVEHRSLSASEVALLGTRRLFWEFMAWTGIRLQEAARLRRCDFDLGDRPSVTVPGEASKNGITATVPISRRLSDSLRSEIGMLAPASLVFDIPARKDTAAAMLLRDAEHCGIDRAGLNVRSFRKTFVTWLRASGADGVDIIRLRRDKGRGSESLVAWNYTDDKVVDERLRRTLSLMEAWIDSQNGLRAAK